MQKRIIYFVVLIFLSTSVMAQNRGVRMTREEAINQKWNSIVEKLELTASEKQLAEPIFKEAEQQIWKLLQKNWQVYRQYRELEVGSEEHYEALNKNMIDFEVQNVVIQKRYYEALKKAGLSAKAINQLLNAEKEFRRNLMRKDPPQQRGRRGQGRK